MRRVTSGEFDVIRVLHIDEKADRVYFLASPDNPTQHYLYRAPLIGSGTPERVSPADQPGWHDYAISPDAAMAVHTYSAFGKPPRVETRLAPRPQGHPHARGQRETPRDGGEAGTDCRSSSSGSISVAG